MKFIRYTDEEAFLRLKEIARQEGLLVGSSSGAALAASLGKPEKAKPGTNIVTIFPTAVSGTLAVTFMMR